MMSFKVKFLMILTGVFVGAIFVSHIRSIPARSFGPENSAEKQFVMESLLKEQVSFKGKIAELRKQINEKQEKLLGTTRTERVEYLDTLKKQLGLIPVNGAGIEIIFDDSPSVERALLDVNNESLVHAADLRDIVNVLRVSRAEVISVNDQRIIATSPITCVGNSVLINNSHTSPPFIISVIGDRDVIKNNLLSEEYLSSLRERIKMFGLVFEVYSKKNIEVPVFNGDLRAKYIE